MKNFYVTALSTKKGFFPKGLAMLGQAPDPTTLCFTMAKIS